MCPRVDAPDIKIDKPQVLRNPFLDDARSDTGLVRALRTGRSALRIPTGSSPNLFTPRNAANSAGGTAGARGNARRTGGVTPTAGAVTTPTGNASLRI